MLAVFGFRFGFVTVLSLLPHALSEPRVDAGRCPEVIVSFSETSGQDHMVLIVIVFIFRALDTSDDDKIFASSITIHITFELKMDFPF